MNEKENYENQHHLLGAIRWVNISSLTICTRPIIQAKWLSMAPSCVGCPFAALRRLCFSKFSQCNVLEGWSGSTNTSATIPTHNQVTPQMLKRAQYRNTRLFNICHQPPDDVITVAVIVSLAPTHCHYTDDMTVHKASENWWKYFASEWVIFFLAHQKSFFNCIASTQRRLWEITGEKSRGEKYETAHFFYPHVESKYRSHTWAWG